MGPRAPQRLLPPVKTLPLFDKHPLQTFRQQGCLGPATPRAKPPAPSRPRQPPGLASGHSSRKAWGRFGAY